jgi:hypothetical protein
VAQSSRLGLANLAGAVLLLGALMVARLVWIGVRCCRYANGPETAVFFASKPAQPSGRFIAPTIPA